MRTLRRITLKFGLLVAALLIIVFIVESAIFHIIGRNGWLISGPQPAPQQVVEWLAEQSGRLPEATDGGKVLAPLMPPGDTGRDWYPMEIAGASAHVETVNGLIIYSISTELQLPHLSPLYYVNAALNGRIDVWTPIASGIAIVSSEGELWCRVNVKAPHHFRNREYVGSVDDFMPSPLAAGWHTMSVHPFALVHNIGILLLLFGWPFFIGDARNAIRQWRSRREEKYKRLPRPTTLRTIGVRFSVLVIGAGTLAYAIDAIVFPRAMATGTAMVFSTITDDDKEWWEANLHVLPPETFGPFDGPPAIEAVQGSWLVPYGAHGGSGGPGLSTPAFATSLVAYSIVPNPGRSKYLPLRGRVLAGSDGQVAYRLEMPLPFVIHERTYIGCVDDGFVPNPLDEQWAIRFRPLGFVANAALIFIVFGIPVYLRDSCAVVRIMRGRCTSCGYLLRCLQGTRCPECGCALV